MVEDKINELDSETTEIVGVVEDKINELDSKTTEIVGVVEDKINELDSETTEIVGVVEDKINELDSETTEIVGVVEDKINELDSKTTEKKSIIGILKSSCEIDLEDSYKREFDIIEARVENPIVYKNYLHIRKKYDRSVLCTIPNLEYDEKEDMTIDYSDRTEINLVLKDWGCQKWVDSKKHFCEEKTVVNDMLCSRHKRYISTQTYKLCIHSNPMFEVDIAHYKIHTGMKRIYWFPRLQLAGLRTCEGIVAIGRIRGNRWLETLGEREIKRCENVGLLYKVLPQEILHYTYHIGNIEKIEGVGFTSYEQIRASRPTLYLKYWKIWNEHIVKRREFITNGEKITDKHKWYKEWRCQLPNWEEVKKEYMFKGWYNVIVPPPTLEQIKDNNFDVFDYCEEWCRDNYVAKCQYEVGFPPMYIDHPNIGKTGGVRNMPRYFTPYEYEYLTPDFDDITKVKQYRYLSEMWFDRITVEGKEWDEIYF